MVGIYEISNGLHFTGKVAETKEQAENYLGQLYGSLTREPVRYDEEGQRWIYEEVFTPWYNKEVFHILPVVIV